MTRDDLKVEIWKIRSDKINKSDRNLTFCIKIDLRWPLGKYFWNRVTKLTLRVNMTIFRIFHLDWPQMTTLGKWSRNSQILRVWRIFSLFFIFVKNLTFSSSQIPFRRVYTILLNFDLWWPRMTSESLLRKAF